MATLSISKATAFHFRIGASPGSGTGRDGNYLYPDVAEYNNIQGPENKLNPIQNHKAQIWNEGDSTSFQINYNNAGVAPIAIVKDATDDSPVKVISMSEVTTDVWEGTVTMSDLGEGCFYIEIQTFDAIIGPNAFLAMDDGTAETDINNFVDANTGNYTTTRDSTFAQAGTWAYKRDYSSGTPASDDKLIGYNDLVTPGGSIGVPIAVTGYVYMPDNSPSANYLASNAIVRWAPDNSDGFGTPATANSGWGADAVIISETTWSAADTDAWHKVESVFLLDTTDLGYLRLESDKVPGQAEIYVDTITLRGADVTTEAISETFYISSNHQDSVDITYSNDDSGLDLYYSGATGNLEHTIRAFWDGMIQFEFEDADYIQDKDSVGVSSTHRAFPDKIYTLRFNKLTEAMAEKILLAFRHDNVAVNGIDLVLVDASNAPVYDIHTGTFIVELRAKVKDYNYQNSNC